MVHGDADSIERIALNLIENAISHGGKGVAINISARRTGEVVAIDPPRLFAFSWSEGEATEGASLVSFELFEVAGGTRLTLTHSRQPLPMVRRTAAGWHAHLELLIEFMHGKTPEWESVYPPAEEAYTALVASLT